MALSLGPPSYPPSPMRMRNPEAGAIIAIPAAVRKKTGFSAIILAILTRPGHEFVELNNLF